MFVLTRPAKHGQSDVVTVNLGLLRFFQKPKCKWDLHVASGMAYSNCLNQTNRLFKLDLIKIVNQRPALKNPTLIVKEYGLTQKGKALLDAFAP